MCPLAFEHASASTHLSHSLERASGYCFHNSYTFSKYYSVAASLQPFTAFQEREKNVFQCWRCLPGDVRNGVRVPRGLACGPAALEPCIASCMFAPGWMHYMMGSLLLLSSWERRKVSGKHKTRDLKERAA